MASSSSLCVLLCPNLPHFTSIFLSWYFFPWWLQGQHQIQEQQPFRNYIKSVPFDKAIFLSFLKFYFFGQTHVLPIHMCIFSMESAYSYGFSKIISFNPHSNHEMCTTIIPITDEETRLTKTKWPSLCHTPKWVMKLKLKRWEHDKESAKV